MAKQESVASELTYHLGWVLNPGGMPPPKLSKAAAKAIDTHLVAQGMSDKAPFEYWLAEWAVDNRCFPRLLSDIIKGLK